MRPSPLNDSTRPRSARRRPGTVRPLAGLAGLAVVALTLAACGSGGGGDPEAYPEDDITLIVPFAAGGPTDTVTRLIAEPMGEELGAAVIVQNAEGAGGTLGTADVADADPDGYTVLMQHIGMSTAPSLYSDLSYDPLEDFKTVGLVTEVPMTIVARADFEPDTTEELATYLQENSETVTLANAGVGSAAELCALLLQDAFGVELTGVPYDGTGPALQDLVGGQVDLLCDQTTNTTGQIQSGELKAYAVTTPERVEVLPDVPTTEEEGFGEFQVSVWHGLYVPAETPDEVVEKLTAALQVALKDQNVVDQLAQLGTAPSSPEDATPEALTEQLSSQIELWQPIIEEAGVSAD